MIHDLDETLRQLLIKKAGLDPSEVDISFDIPTRDWSTPVTRPTINLYLYDIRENRQLRELDYEETPTTEGRVRVKRMPVRIDLSYMVTCWTSATEDQHRLLWHVLETLFRHSPLPDDVLQGSLKKALLHPVRTEVAQPDGVLKNVSDFWGALENQIRPSINLITTLDLDLNQIKIEALTFAKLVKVGDRVTERDAHGREIQTDRLAPGWELLPARLGGIITSQKGEPVPNAMVRLTRSDGGKGTAQAGPAVVTDAEGRYLLTQVPAGNYTLVVEAPGFSLLQDELVVVAKERGERLPELLHQLEVMPKKK